MTEASPFQELARRTGRMNLTEGELRHLSVSPHGW